MTPEEQRIAIAEWEGWKERNHCKGYYREDQDGWIEELPDYLNDLNAMHDAVTLLSVDKRVVFYGHLYSIVCKSFMGDSTEDSLAFALVNATAAQRAEALLRTIGKWNDKPQCQTPEGK